MADILRSLGVLPYLHVLRENYFPTNYHKKALLANQDYMVFYSQFVKKGDLSFDIGAHRGHRTEILLQLGAKVVAIEPQKDLYKYLKFKFGKKIQLENCGISSKNGTEALFINNYSSLSTFSQSWVDEFQKGRFANSRWIAKKIIEVHTLDYMIEKYGLPDFCKIDVESYEYEVLSGLNKNIRYISFEFMIPENLYILKKCINHLISLNPLAEFNYASEDKLKLALPEWILSSQINEFLDLEIFSTSSWGDIYVHMP